MPEHTVCHRHSSTSSCTTCSEQQRLNSKKHTWPKTCCTLTSLAPGYNQILAVQRSISQARVVVEICPQTCVMSTSKAFLSTRSSSGPRSGHAHALRRRVVVRADPDEEEFEARLARLNKSKVPTGVSRKEIRKAGEGAYGCAYSYLVGP